MTWLAPLLGGGGFVILLGGLVKAVLMLGEIRQAVRDFGTRADRQDERTDRLENRVDRLTNGRGQAYSHH